MDVYLVKKRLPLGAGAIIGLDERQAGCRRHRLKPLGEGRYQLLEPMEFKVGEVLGIEEELPKIHLDHVEVVPPAGDKKTKGRTKVSLPADEQ